MTSKPHKEMKRIKPMPSENINFPSTSQIGWRSGLRAKNAHHWPVIKQEAPESHSHWSVMDEVPVGDAVTILANSSAACDAVGGEVVDGVGAVAEVGADLAGIVVALEAEEGLGLRYWQFPEPEEAATHFTMKSLTVPAWGH